MNMTADEKRAELKQLMSEYSVSAREVSELLGVAYQTVINWRSPASGNVPASKTLRLLKFELEARNANSTKEKTQ